MFNFGFLSGEMMRLCCLRDTLQRSAMNIMLEGDFYWCKRRLGFSSGKS